MKRYGLRIKVKKERLDEYKKLHANCWPSVLEIIRGCNIRNYSIYYQDGCLFAYYEYVGDDYQKDMERMGRCDAMKDWWKLTDPMQEKVSCAKPGEWWSEMEEVFHTD